MNYLRSRKPLASPVSQPWRKSEVPYHFCGKTRRSFKPEDFKIINDKQEIKVSKKRRGHNRVKNTLGNEEVS